MVVLRDPCVWEIIILFTDMAVWKMAIYATVAVVMVVKELENAIWHVQASLVVTTIQWVFMLQDMSVSVQITSALLSVSVKVKFTKFGGYTAWIYKVEYTDVHTFIDQNLWIWLKQEKLSADKTSHTDCSG